MSGDEQRRRGEEQRRGREVCYVETVGSFVGFMGCSRVKNSVRYEINSPNVRIGAFLFREAGSVSCKT
jgi:hypothetical protein